MFKSMLKIKAVGNTSIMGIPNHLIHLIKGIYRRNTIVLQDVVVNTRRMDKDAVCRLILFNIFIYDIIKTWEGIRIHHKI